MNPRHIILIGLLCAVCILPVTQPVRAAAPPGMLVQQRIQLSGDYSLFNLQVNERVILTINGTLGGPIVGQESLTVQVFFDPNAVGATAYSTSGAQQITPTISAPARVVNPWTFLFVLPANTTAFNIQVSGSYTGSSILWKDQLQVAPVTVSELGLIPKYSLVVPYDGSTVVKKVIATGFDYNSTTYAGIPTISSSGYFTSFVVLLYQPAAWDIVAWGLLALAVVSTLVVSSRAIDRLRSGRNLFGNRMLRPFRWVWGTLERADSHKFLSVFVIIALLMVSLSFMAGPDPRVKVFVIASDATTAQIKSTMQQSLGNVQILTPSDTESEFNTMATLGTVQVVVVSDYNKLDIPSVEKYILDSLNLVPVTILVGNANPTLANYTNKLYNGTALSSGTSLLPVSTTADLGSKAVTDEIHRSLRLNNLSLQLGVTTFILVAGVVGLLSFVLVTFGIAFLVSKLIEMSGKPLVSALTEGVFYSGGVFFFIQAVYMSSSALLGWPLGLHAVTSGSSQLTVLGLFHLGAGNDPRTLAAILGLVLAAAPALWSRMDKYLAMAIGALVFFVVVDPLTGGTVFFEFATMLTGGPQVGFANTTLISVKSFLNQIGTDSAGWISGNFGISSGEMFYYFGAVPLALISKFQRSTATLALIFCGFAACDGIVRVAEMTAYKTEPSMVAGVLAGLLLAVTLLGVNRVEGFVRRNFPSRR